MVRSRPASNPLDLQPTVSEKVRYLQDVLGPKLTALLIGVSDAGMLTGWADGETRPDPDAERRLHDAFEITQLLLHEESPQAARTWFLGMNPDLDDRAPALVLAEEPELVAEAARILVDTG